MYENRPNTGDNPVDDTYLTEESTRKAQDLKQTIADTTNRVASGVSQRANELKNTISDVPGKVDDLRQHVETAFDEEPLRTVREEVTVVSGYLVDQVRLLIAAGNVRRLIIQDQNGRTLLEIPLTVGVVAGMGMIAMAPFWATLLSIAALFTQVRVVIERYEEPSIEKAELNLKAENES